MVGIRKPKIMRELLWIKTILGNLKTRLGDAYLLIRKFLDPLAYTLINLSQRRLESF